jgi:hypothetical protein
MIWFKMPQDETSLRIGQIVPPTAGSFNSTIAIKHTLRDTFHSRGLTGNYDKTKK